MIEMQLFLSAMLMVCTVGLFVVLLALFDANHDVSCHISKPVYFLTGFTLSASIMLFIMWLFN